MADKPGSDFDVYVNEAERIRLPISRLKSGARSLSARGPHLVTHVDTLVACGRLNP
ncbi:unnamed protein product [Calypogeia fissa]